MCYEAFDMKETVKLRSLKAILSFMVTIIIIIVVSLVVFLARDAAYNIGLKAYINQMQNFNKSIEEQMVFFLDTEIKNAVFLSKDPRVIMAVSTGNYEMARPLLKNVFFEKKIYEQVFLSSAEEDSQIKVSGDGKADGVRWGKIPVYTQNAEKALKGEIHVSNAGKSPVTGLTVILVTAPVFSGGKVVGIVGLPVDVGTYSISLVQKIKIGKTGYPFITDSSGITFAHPNKDFIFKLHLKNYDWGREILASESNKVIRYNFEGRDKLITFIKNQRFGFISGCTMYVDDVTNDLRAADLYMFPIALALLLLSAFIVYQFMKKRLNPLQECEGVMRSMAEGDLTKRYTGEVTNDEIGNIARALNNSLERFEELVAVIMESVEGLARAVGEISGGNENLSQRTAEQSSSLEEIAATVEEANATTRQNAESSKAANSLAEKSSVLAVEGGNIVEGAVAAINEINASGSKISEIISLINEIAFQTNLLALNAAVEAARAGEQGRGFAVVAGEVRNLAQRSGNAAKEIAELIKDSVDKVNTGTELANKSGEALKEIIASVQEVGRLISEITAASEEQRQGMDQINLAVTEMDTMTQQNAALVEETASASEEMASQAQELLNMVRRFEISGKTGTKRLKNEGGEKKALKSVQEKSVPGEKKTPSKKSDFIVEKKTTAPHPMSKSLKDEGFEEF